MTVCCACSILNIAMSSPTPPCTPGILLGISCSPASHIILPPSTNHPGKSAREIRPNCSLWKYAPKAAAHHHFIPTFGCKPHRLSRSCSHTQRASQPQQKQFQYLQLRTENLDKAFSWPNSLTTLCLSMYKTYLCLCALPQSWRRNLSSRKVHDLCSWWCNAHQSLHELYQGKHLLWPGDCTAYKLKTQLQFYHCSYHLAAKAEKKEKVILGGVQHADSTNLDLWIIP